jgi:hypothetical protein
MHWLGIRLTKTRNDFVDHDGNVLRAGRNRRRRTARRTSAPPAPPADDDDDDDPPF